jgi:hypothetical protein
MDGLLAPSTRHSEGYCIFVPWIEFLYYRNLVAFQELVYVKCPSMVSIPSTRSLPSDGNRFTLKHTDVKKQRNCFRSFYCRNYYYLTYLC